MNLKAACRPSNKCFSWTHRWYRIWPTALLFGAIQAPDVLGQNSGSREGDEVPQLYIHQEVSSVTTWEKRLCGFDRVQLTPGETKGVTLTIAPENLAIWNLEMKRVIEPGNFKVMVGASSNDIRLNGEFEIAP
jgi:hypothetical protein